MTTPSLFPEDNGYVGAPYVRGSETSRAAAASVVHHVQSDCERIFRLIERFGGMTCDEVEVELGMPHQTASARIKQLRDEGRIAKSVKKRPTRSRRSAVVYVVRAGAERMAR